MFGLLVSACVGGATFGIGWWFLSFALYKNLDEKDFTVQVCPRCCLFKLLG